MRLPTGGYERYQYQQGAVNTSTSPPYSQAYRHVVNRYVSASGTGTDEVQWQYGGSGSAVTITAPDNSQVQRSMYGESTADGWGYSPEGGRAGMPYDERIYSAPDGGGVRHMLRRTLTEWTMTGSNAVGLLDVNKATRNARMTKQVEILLDTSGNALAKTTVYGYDTTYQYDVGVDQTSVTEYDYASVDQNTAQTGAITSIPTGTLLRTTQTSYLTSNSSYRSRNIVGLPTSVTVQSASGATVAQMAISYDEPTYQLGNTYGTVTGWSDPGAVRGNLTTTSHWLDTTNTWIPTHAQYDQAGSVVSTWDANGNQTQVTYSSSYAYPTSTTSAVPDPTNAYGSNTPLTTSTAYDFSTGLVTSKTDANGQTTTVQYNDSLDRLTQVNYPGGGQTTYNYVDQHQCGAYVETLTLLDSSGRQFHNWQFSDGLGRPYLAESTDGQDANNPYLRVDTQYDAMGRAYRVSNPYRTPGCTSAVNPSGQWTTTAFDALGRATSVTAPDSAVITTSYSGNAVTATDQRLNKRSSVSDALGRLTQVTEDPTTGGYNYQTTYTYDVLGNLRKVSQGSQVRYYMYDSLSRLIRAKNPEQAAGSVASNMTDPVTGNTQWSMAYGYDNNGNLTARVDARNITTNYAYDHLNRNTNVSYTSDPASTPPVTRAYDGVSGSTQLIPNGRGRLWYSVTTGGTGSLTAVDSYDAMGRVTAQHQRFAVASEPGGGTYWLGQLWSASYNVTSGYDKAGHVLTETYPSGHSVTYNYDIAGRLGDNGSQLAFTGNIGDGVARTYATQATYSPFGGIQQEQFGTQVPLYRKLHYNVRGQVFDLRLSTLSWVTDQWDWGRGAVLNYYATADLNATSNDGCGLSGPDNNGDLRRESIYVPTDPSGTYNASTAGAYYTAQQSYGYDSVNRLTSVSETNYSTAAGTGATLSQGYHYDQWGNRTIDANQTSGAPNTQFTVDAATNRLGVPAGQSGAMGYDAAVNLTLDSYTGNGSRTYDANNRMVNASDSYGGTSTYTYDADGKRVRRANMYGETWQVYGIGGELLAEYASTAAVYLPQKEYGYRNGELVVTMSSGNSQRLAQFVTNLYYGALQRDPTSTELQNGINQLAAAGAQGESQLQTSAAQLARSLFTSTSYETTTTPSRSSQQ